LLQEACKCFTRQPMPAICPHQAIDPHLDYPETACE
jgi:hypothetical protein